LIGSAKRISTSSVSGGIALPVGAIGVLLIALNSRLFPRASHFAFSGMRDRKNFTDILRKRLAKAFGVGRLKAIRRTLQRNRRNPQMTVPRPPTHAATATAAVTTPAAMAGIIPAGSVGSVSV